ncbi:hypothetical protein CHS0354_035532 [Potamilus streckersoni]|uniref:J domain-containing protein n=1 Tax=Potamilus streckersoni TaxID=2493646 RepID=A0AAE0VIJ0_9BIVA|nr:hypothetical protein CHS0354_035532 [Potamilus streckersoni]
MSGLFESCRALFETDNLYAVLKIKETATDNEVKKAYHKLSLKVHPDRVASSEKELATQKFQILGKVYSILSDPETRKIYDETGSKEELEDLRTAYLSFKGDMNLILDNVMCSTIDDEPRFKKIIKDWIKKKEVPNFSKFSHESKSKAEKRKREAEEEAVEAEQLKMELGIGSNDSLKQLIQKQQQSREKEADAFFASLEKKYAEPQKAPKSNKKTKASAAKKSKK